MDRVKKQKISKIFANAFGALGYFSCALQWLWVVMLYIGYLFTIVSLTIPTDTIPEIDAVIPVNAHINPTWTIVLAIVLTVFMVAVAIYSMIKMPATMAKTSKNIAHLAADAAVPLIIKASHKKTTKKLRIKLTARIIFVIKIAIIFIPILLTIISRYTSQPQIDYLVSVTIILALAIFSIFSFICQYALAKFSNVRVSELW